MPSHVVKGSTAVLWLPPLLWAGVLFALSSGSGPAFAPPIPHLDKLQHAGAYGLLGFLLARAVGGTWPALAEARVVVAAGVGCALYGISDELHQSFTPGRAVEVADAVADTVGGFAGAVSFIAVARRFRLRPARGG